jgi:hypothetical protein
MLSHVRFGLRDLHERLTLWWQQILPGIATAQAAEQARPAGSAELDLPGGRA